MSVSGGRSFTLRLISWVLLVLTAAPQVSIALPVRPGSIPDQRTTASPRRSSHRSVVAVDGRGDVWLSRSLFPLKWKRCCRFRTMVGGPEDSLYCLAGSTLWCVGPYLGSAENWSLTSGAAHCTTRLGAPPEGLDEVYSLTGDSEGRVLIAHRDGITLLDRRAKVMASRCVQGESLPTRTIGSSHNALRAFAAGADLTRPLPTWAGILGRNRLWAISPGRDTLGLFDGRARHGHAVRFPGFHVLSVTPGRRAEILVLLVRLQNGDLYLYRLRNWAAHSRLTRLGLTNAGLKRAFPARQTWTLGSGLIAIPIVNSSGSNLVVLLDTRRETARLIRRWPQTAVLVGASGASILIATDPTTSSLAVLAGARSVIPLGDLPTGTVAVFTEVNPAQQR